MPYMFWTSAIFALLLVQSSRCLLRNVTVDDEYGDPETGESPTYGPATNGNIWRLGPSCDSCHMTQVINQSKTYSNTWHDCTWFPGNEPNFVAVNFEGEDSKYYRKKLCQKSNFYKTICYGRQKE